MVTISRKVNPISPQLLIVDRQDSVRVAIVGLLEHLGWEVVEATNFKRAIELCSFRRFDVVLANLSMPDEENGEAIHAFRHANPDGQSTTIIAYSNEDQPPLTNPSADPQIDLYIDTPLESKHLPVYIALASTRRIEKISRGRAVSQVYN